LKALSHEKLALSVLLPMHNEVEMIEKCVREVEKAVESLSISYEIIIAEDGSTDGTNIIAEHLANNNPRLKHLHSPVRLGKGGAIKNALHVANGEIIVFVDADLATNLEYLQRIVVVAEKSRGIAIGSRLVSESKVTRSISRTVFCLIYNILVRSLFFDGVRDHQCGFKALSHALARTLVDEVKSTGFFIDTEMIVRAKRRGFPITEIGVEWSERTRNGQSKVKLFRDSLQMGIELLKLRFRLDREKQLKFLRKTVQNERTSSNYSA